MVRLACWAMNTRFEVALCGEDEAHLTPAGEEALREIQLLDQQLSFFRSDSDIRALNVYAATAPMPAEPRLFGLLKRAIAISEAMEGAFDPTTAPLLRCWGLAGEGGRLPSEGELRSALDAVGVGHLQLDEERFTIAFDREGVMLDLGAIGKGYALERAAAILREHEVAGALIHAGTSSVYGLGAPPGAGAWRIGIRHPTRPDEQLTTVGLRDRALGVSAPHGRFFVHDGERYGHVIDPRTGQPVRGALLAAVAMDSPTDADALSTALLVLGEPGLRTVAACCPGAQALVVLEAGSAEPQTTSIEWEDA